MERRDLELSPGAVLTVTLDGSRRSRRRQWAIAGAVAVLLVFVVGGTLTHWYGFAYHDPDRGASIAACEDKLRPELAVPDSAQFRDVSAAKAAMVLEDRDRIGPDADKVLAHWGVGGTVESKNTGGGRVSSRFSCEVYFLPDEIRTSLQVFDADMSGQWRPGRP